MEHVPALGGMKQKRAFGWINGVEFMTATFPYKGEGLWVGVPKAARVAAGLVVGDKCTMELMLDESPRTVEVPPELAAAFAAEPESGRAIREAVVLAEARAGRSDQRGEETRDSRRAPGEGTGEAARARLGGPARPRRFHPVQVTANKPSSTASTWLRIPPDETGDLFRP